MEITLDRELAPILRDLAKQHGPLMHLQLGEVSAIVVSSPEMAKRSWPYVLAFGIVTYGCKDIAMAPYGNYWRQQENFFIDIWDHIKSSIWKQIQPRNIHICCRRNSKVGSGFSLADLYPSLKVLQLISGMRQKLGTLHRKSDKTLQGIIDEHRERLTRGKTGNVGEEKEDLVPVLLKIQQLGDLECPLTDEDIKAVVWVNMSVFPLGKLSPFKRDFSSLRTLSVTWHHVSETNVDSTISQDIFSGGSETSSTSVDWEMAEMMKNPRVLKKAQNEVRQVCHGKGDVNESSIQELKFLTSVIKETLRIHPSLPLLFPRESGLNCEINGYHVPVKTKVIINAWAI
ncbi:hypothetical protein PTKIN_Ptkin14bG0017400 [Pterospermum kingtungense]